MNNENLEFLQDSLKYLGFGEKLLLNDQLEQWIEKESKEFQLEIEAFFDEDHKLEVTLYFRRSDQLDMYFFNKYEARLRSTDEPANDRAQIFYISKGTGVTLKEAYNLLQGRAVNKDLTNAEGQKYNAWIQLNFGEKDQYNNYKVKQYRSQYGYDLEKTLEKYPIREFKNEEWKAALVKSLKRGNLHTVSFEKPNKTEKMLIEANPQYKTINIYPVANRSAGKTSLKQDQPLAQASGSKPGRRDQPEEEAEGVEGPEGADPGEIKEDEAELPGSKQGARKRAHK